MISPKRTHLTVNESPGRFSLFVLCGVSCLFGYFIGSSSGTFKSSVNDFTEILQSSLSQNEKLVEIVKNADEIIPEILLENPPPTVFNPHNLIKQHYDSSSKPSFKNLTMSLKPRSNITHYLFTPQNFSKPLLYPKPQLGWKIVGFTDTKYLWITRLWYMRMKELGYKNLLIVALDEPAFLILESRVQLGELESNEIRLAHYTLEDAFSTETENKTGSNDWVMNKNIRHKSKSIWKIRINMVKILLEEGWSVFVTDVDSIWMKYVDLEKFPENIDAFFVKTASFPARARAAWGFTICGGVVGFRPTKAIFEMFTDLAYWCNSNCDDQLQMNYRLMQYRVEWYDNSSESEFEPIRAFDKENFEDFLFRTKNLTVVSKNDIGLGHSPVNFFRIGQTTHEVFFRVAVYRGNEAIRGGEPEDCWKPESWFLNPLMGSALFKKVGMFNYFKDCIGVKEILCNPYAPNNVAKGCAGEDFLIEDDRIQVHEVI